MCVGALNFLVHLVRFFLFALFGLSFSLLILTLLRQLCTGVSIPRGYSRTEKDEALDALALAMLLVRDKRPQLEAILTQCDEQKDDNGGAQEKSARHTASNEIYTTKWKKDGKSTQDSPVAGKEGAILLQLVDQLATLAAAAEKNQKLYHQTESEPVHINWSELSRRLGGKDKSTGSSSRAFSTNGPTDSVADVEMATISDLHSNHNSSR